AGLLVAAGWLGAHLSYARGVGVDTTAFQVAPAEWADVLPDEQLPPDTPTLVHADGVPVLLLRRGTTVHALADRCTHRGAPLHEGALAGDCIVCPWHDSSFRITDGQVVDGPATRSQPVYEVRLRYGSIQVRRREEPGSLRTNPVS
ncbi:MAG: Rieske (2Fe-2S) protein, partial [Jatrophihabitans sp.]